MAEFNSFNRRSFIKSTSYLIGFGAIASSPFSAIGAKDNKKYLTVLHTNDWHSRIDPFPDTDKNNAGKGGAAARAALIKKIRAEAEHVLLLDAGDIFQGTPYFNFYEGALEYKLMTEMGYDIVTLGNHDFDNGVNGIVKQLPHAGFQIVNSNYDFSKSALNGKVYPYHIIRKQGIKIGVFGLGIDLKGLVPDANFENISYSHPIAVAEKTAQYLRHHKNCDLVICLSHLGYEYKDNQVSDLVLANSKADIDLIIGGHTHTFLKEPILVKNQLGKNVLVNQVGWAGMQLGRIDFEFEKNRWNHNSKSSSSIEINK